VTDDLRPLLFSIAYRMLGSVAEAEDVVQEAYLRRASASSVAVENERAYMTTVTSRLAIDVLRSARVRRETYVGDWLPEPLVEPEAPAVVETEESVSLAMLVLLERLNPVERAVFVLRDSFDLAFDQIAGIVDRSEDNCRQILSRARKRVADERPRFDADPRERRTLAARFLAAAREGDLEGLVAVLAPDAVLIGDGGGIARSIPHPMHGAEAIARALVAFYGQVSRLGVTLEPVWVNGQPGFRTSDADGRVVNVVGLDIVDGRVASIYSILNPEKLGHLGETSALGLRPSRSAPPR
jgi:RNA polymerase sigma-70 factor (ECF subfamily)